MKFKREIRILTLFLTVAYGVLAEGQAQSSQQPPESTLQQTAPSEVTTVNPMDPVNDSRRMNDSQMLILQRKNKAMAPAPASGTTESYPRY